MDQSHLPRKGFTRVRTVILELAQHRLDNLRRLVLAHLPLGHNSRGHESQAHCAATVAASVGGDLGAGVERAGMGDVLLKVIDEPSQDLEILLGIEHLRNA